MIYLIGKQRSKKIEMLYSRLYKKYFSFTHSSDVQMLDEKERTKLAKCVKNTPAIIEQVAIDRQHRSARMGYVYKLKWDKITDFHVRYKDLSEKILKGNGLSEEEVEAINTALWVHKYNRILRFLLMDRLLPARLRNFREAELMGKDKYGMF